MLKNFSEKHPIIFLIVSSSLATLVYNYFFEPILNKIEKLNFVLIVSANSEKPQSFTFNLFTVLFAVALIAYIIYMLSYMFAKKHVQKQMSADAKDCESCDMMDELRTTNKELKQQLESAAPYKVILDKLEAYANDTDVIDSIQLFSYSSLPKASDLTDEPMVDLSVRFIDGVAKETSNTNALLNMQYHFDRKIYKLLKDVFDKRNDYYVDLTRPSSKENEDDIQESAFNVSKIITEELNSLNDLEQIEDTHYACYRMLEILTNIVLFKEKAVECRKLLQCKDDIEDQLKSGQRTGILGSMFTNKMYCFYNENSTTKKDRIYFSAPVLYKEKPLTLLVVAQKSKLKTTETIDHIDCCKEIYDDIQKVLTA